MDLSPKDIKVEYLSNYLIGKKVNEFKNFYDVKDQFPVNIELIIEKNIGLNIEPKSGIEEECNIFALLQHDLITILVDAGHLLNDRFKNIYRFDLAHEIGHWFLHKEVYQNVSFKSLDEWYSFMKEMPEKTHMFFEYQANEFAGQLLVPRALLKSEILPYKDEINEIMKENPEMGIVDIIPYIAPRILQKFGVSEKVISIRLKREKIIHDLIDLSNSEY